MGSADNLLCCFPNFHALFTIYFQFKNSYYFCNQEVEEETGSAGEHPVSNRLPALRSNKFCFGRLTCMKPVFLPFSFVTDNAVWLKKPNR
jgi:hypothetical protein